MDLFKSVLQSQGRIWWFTLNYFLYYVTSSLEIEYMKASQIYLDSQVWQPCIGIPIIHTLKYWLILSFFYIHVCVF